MIQQFTIKRGGKDYVVNIGITGDNKSKLYLQGTETEVEFNSAERWSFDSLFIDTNKESIEGEVNLIRTIWRKNKVSVNGIPMEGNQVMEIMLTRKEEIRTFLSLLSVSMPILMFMINGLVRDIMGFNHLPVFGTTIDPQTGQVGSIIKSYSEFMENSEPTNDYSTYNSGDPLPNSLIEE